MKYILAILLFSGFFVQAQMEEPSRSTGFFAFNIGAAVDTKLTSFDYPVSLSYGGNILKDRYVGDFEVGLAFYRAYFYFPMHLLFKYAYDFMRSSSDWGFGVDTSLYLGGATISYLMDKDGNVVERGSDKYIDIFDQSKVEKQGVNFYIGHDLGLFLKRRIKAQALVALLRVGVNNALLIKPRFMPDKSDTSSGDKTKKEEEIKVVREWLTPSIYLGTGVQWYF